MKIIYLAFLLLTFGGVVLMSNRSIEENKYTEYIVIEECGDFALRRLRDRVNDKLLYRWEPMGGIEFYNGMETCVYQSMVR